MYHFFSNIANLLWRVPGCMVPDELDDDESGVGVGAGEVGMVGVGTGETDKVDGTCPPWFQFCAIFEKSQEIVRTSSSCPL